MVDTTQKLGDSDILPFLEKASVGRTAKELAGLTYLAHEKVARDSERAKHNQLGDSFEKRADYLLDGEGSHHAIVSFGLALEALLQGNPAEFTHQLDQLFKSCMLTHSDYAMQVRNRVLNGAANGQ